MNMKFPTDAMPNPAAQRDANGWRAVIEFPNGGRQVFASRHGTFEAAYAEADHAMRIRIKHPEACVRDPRANEYQEIEKALL